MTTATVNLRSKRCNSLLQTDSDQPKPNDMVKCPRHGDIGRYNDVVKDAKKLILARVEAEFKKMLSKSGLKLK